MKLALIIIGDEILNGERKDKNFEIALAKLKGQANIDFVAFVRDNLVDLTETLQFIKNNAEVVITSGGLGLTPDDITLQAFSKAFSIPIVKSKEKLQVVLENIKRCKNFFYENYIEELSEGLLNATPIENPVGVASGERLTIGSTTFYILPGVPREFESMLDVIIKELKKDDEKFKHIFEVDEKEANLISALRMLEGKFDVKTASYPPIEPNEKLKIILYADNKETLNGATKFFEEYLRERRINFTLKTN